MLLFSSICVFPLLVFCPASKPTLSFLAHDLLQPVPDASYAYYSRKTLHTEKKGITTMGMSSNACYNEQRVEELTMSKWQTLPYEVWMTA